MHWWETETALLTPAASRIPAVAYYRHSAQDRQENSIPIQRDQVREWAEKNGIEIIQEFSDAGKSGLNAEGRPAFNDMMENWVAKRDDFQYILCLDVSRWGRFQDIDLSAQYSAICKKHGKTVIYTTIGKPREDDPLYPVYVQFERFRAAQYSKELSDKVWRGCVRIVEQGYWPGSKPPYALRRLLLDESREPLHILEPGQRKGIQNQRVTLTAGPDEEVVVIRRIFHEFVEERYSEHRIAEGLNANGISSPGGRLWTGGLVVNRLRNERYVGTMLYNRTSQKLKTPTRHNPPEEWIRTQHAFEGIIPEEQFLKAQELLLQRRKKYNSEKMLQSLEALYKKYGLYRPSLISNEDSGIPASAYARHFGSLDEAFQRLHAPAHEWAHQTVLENIRQRVEDVISYHNFLVLGQKLTISIQPAVPVPSGYAAYWPIRPDHRPVIDITLGVLLSDVTNCDILGYLVLPRWLTFPKSLRFTGNPAHTELWGRNSLDFLDQLLKRKGPHHG